MLASLTPVALIGAGHMGGALIEGWLRSGALTPGDLVLRDPTPGPAAAAAARDGAALNGPDADFTRARIIILAVKPQVWRAVVEPIAPFVAPDAVVISIMAGVGAEALVPLFPGRPIVRVMPTTSAAVLKGAASVWSADPRGRETARRLFEPLGVVVDLAEEALMHVATAASGSAPAYAYALVEALDIAAREAGLDAVAARALSRAALVGAAALLDGGDVEAAELRRQVTSPGGVTEAALKVLIGDGALRDLMARAVAAAVTRSRELGSPS